MTEWEIGEQSFDGVWSSGTYVVVYRNGHVVKEYSTYNPIGKLMARLYVLRHKVFG